jgi:phosphatidylserine decarboxylase
MTIRRTVMRLAGSDRLNFVLTNRIPRRLAGRWVGRISRSENPLVCAASLWLWRCFTDLDLSDAETTCFRSMRDCFTRHLKPGARPIDMDPTVWVSPCDAIVGAFGTVVDGRAMQVKGMDYTLTELLGDAEHAATLEGGTFVTLRLTSAMYHRFHAPCDCRVDQVRHVFGDCWNVNPPTLRRVARLFCRNERVVVRVCDRDTHFTLVAVAAILVSGIRLEFLPLQTNGGAPIHQTYSCNTSVTRGERMGWFEHGSTIIVLGPKGTSPVGTLHQGDRIRMGQALLRVADSSDHQVMDAA